ncbi:iron transporter FeoA [Thiocystis violacea]|nr:iron transporter FeoA [Thiocystis violacea]
MSHQSQPIRLSDLPHGTHARLTEIRGGRHLTRRLLALGLRQGSSLCVVQRRGQGLVLATGEVRIAVGSGIADKLWVTPEDLGPDATPHAVPEEADPFPDDVHPGRPINTAN